MKMTAEQKKVVDILVAHGRQKDQDNVVIAVQKQMYPWGLVYTKEFIRGLEKRKLAVEKMEINGKGEKEFWWERPES